jgi:hypothetical protein
MLDDTDNARRSCAGLRIAFDKPFVPKPATDGSMRLIAHLLKKLPELEHFYHNRELRPTAASVNMLYARFAWSVITLLNASCFRLCRPHICQRHAPLFYKLQLLLHLWYPSLPRSGHALTAMLPVVIQSLCTKPNQQI